MVLRYETNVPALLLQNNGKENDVWRLASGRRRYNRHRLGGPRPVDGEDGVVVVPPVPDSVPERDSVDLEGEDDVVPDDE